MIESPPPPGRSAAEIREKVREHLCGPLTTTLTATFPELAGERLESLLDVIGDAITVWLYRRARR